MAHQPPMGTPSAGDPPASCLRCKTVYLKIVKASPEITFYRCPRCTRHYAGTPGAGLVDRWGSPVSRALYGVIYEPDAIPHAPRIAGELARGRTGPAIEALAREIQLELDEPTQRV